MWASIAVLYCQSTGSLKNVLSGTYSSYIMIEFLSRMSCTSTIFTLPLQFSPLSPPTSLHSSSWSLSYIYMPIYACIYMCTSMYMYDFMHLHTIQNPQMKKKTTHDICLLLLMSFATSFFAAWIRIETSNFFISKHPISLFILKCQWILVKRQSVTTQMLFLNYKSCLVNDNFFFFFLD